MRVTHPMLLYGRTQNEAPSFEYESCRNWIYSGKRLLIKYNNNLLYLFEVSNKLLL